VTAEIYLQYGCGLCAPEQWLNFDASPTLRFERLPIIGKIYSRNIHRFPENVRYGDVTRGLPLADGSCRGVYCSHVLEHLSLQDFDRSIAETFRILAPGGIFRLVVPDLEDAAREYLAAVRHGDGTANSSFMRMTSLGIERRSMNPISWLSGLIGNSRHLWMWDYASLAAKLAEHEFEQVRRASFNDCEDPAFRAVEDRGRFERACALQARKPRCDVSKVRADHARLDWSTPSCSSASGPRHAIPNRGRGRHHA
jgi:SAM-dependent methyltransferase